MVEFIFLSEELLEKKKIPYIQLEVQTYFKEPKTYDIEIAQPVYLWLMSHR